MVGTGGGYQTNSPKIPRQQPPTARPTRPHSRVAFHFSCSFSLLLFSVQTLFSVMFSKFMTPCRTEKVDFSNKLKNQKKQKQKQNHQKNKSTGRITRRNKKKTNKNQKLRKMQVLIFFVFFLFFPWFWFSSLFFCLLWFCFFLFFYFFVKPYILCVVGLIILSSRTNP